MRRKGEYSWRDHKFSHPHEVAVLVPGFGFGTSIEKFPKACAELGVPELHGRGFRRGSQTWITYCFDRLDTAKRFAEMVGGRFGGEVALATQDVTGRRPCLLVARWNVPTSWLEDRRKFKGLEDIHRPNDAGRFTDHDFTLTYVELGGEARPFGVYRQQLGLVIEQLGDGAFIYATDRGRTLDEWPN